MAKYEDNSDKKKKEINDGEEKQRIDIGERSKDVGFILCEKEHSFDELRELSDDLDPDLLTGYLLDNRPHVRGNAIKALSIIGCVPKELPLLLRDSEVSVRRAACQACITLGKQASDAAYWLLPLVADEDQNVSETAILALENMAEGIRDVLMEALKQDREDANKTILKLFVHMGSTALGILKEALSHESSMVRINAGHGLRLLGSKAIDIRDEIIKGLSDPVFDVRVSCALTLVAMEVDQDQPYGFDLDERMFFAEENIKKETLNHIALSNRDSYIPLIAPFLKDPSPEIKVKALETIMKIGEPAFKLLGNAITQCLKDQEPKVVEACLNILSAFPYPPVLIDALDCPAEMAERLIIPLLPSSAVENPEVLTKALNHPSSIVRANFARYLGNVKEKTDIVRIALNALSQDQDHMVREQAKHGLRMLQRKRDVRGGLDSIADFDKKFLTFEELEPMLQGIDPSILEGLLFSGKSEIRANSALALGILGIFSEKMCLLIKDSDNNVRKAVVKAIVRLGSKASKAGRHLINALSDKDEEIRNLVVVALSNIFNEVKDVLIKGLEDKDPPSALFRVFQEKGIEGIECLIGVLDHPSAEVRKNAVSCIKEMAGIGGEKALPFLEKMLTDPDKAVRREVVLAMDAINKQHQTPTFAPELEPIEGFDTVRLSKEFLRQKRTSLSLNKLTKDLETGGEITRYNAALGLGVIGQDAYIAAPHLAISLKDENPEIRCQVAWAIGELGGKAARITAPALVMALYDPDVRVIEAAKEALLKIGEPAIPAMIEGLDVHLTIAKSSVIPLICLMGKSAIPHLIKALSHTSPLVRANSARCLGLLGKEAGQSARSALVSLGLDRDKSVRMEVARAIRAIDGLPESPLYLEPKEMPVEGFDKKLLSREELEKVKHLLNTEQIEELLIDGRDVVRANAALSMAILEKYTPTLTLLLKDANIDVARQAVSTLYSLGEKAVPACRWVIPCLEHKDEEIRKLALQILVNIYDHIKPILQEALRTDPEKAESTILRVFEEKGDVDALIWGLKHDSPLVRINSAKGLEMLATRGAVKAYDDLMALTKDNVKDVRVAVCKALDAIITRRKPKPVFIEPPPKIENFDKQVLSLEILEANKNALNVAELTSMLEDKSDIVRLNALRALGLLGKDAKPAASSIGLALFHPNKEIRIEAIRTLGLIGEAAAPATAHLLVGYLRDTDKDIRDAARSAIRAMGKAGLQALCDGLDASKEIADQTVIPLILELGAEAVPNLIYALASMEPLVRANAARCLGLLGEKAISARSALVAHGLDKDKRVRAEVAKAIRKIDKLGEVREFKEEVKLPSPEFAEKILSFSEIEKMKLDPESLEKALYDGRETVRANSAMAFGVLDKYVNGLGPLLRDSSPIVRRCVAQTMVRLGVKAKDAVSWLLLNLHDKDQEVRRLSISALAKMFDQVLPILINGLRDKEARDGVLEVFYAVKEKALAPLIEALRHDSPLVRANAAQGLEMLARDGAERALSALEEMLSDPVREVRVASEKAIKEIIKAREHPIPTFMPKIEIEGFYERVIPKEEFEGKKDLLDMSILIPKLEDKSLVVRINTIRALSALGSKASYAVSYLTVLLKDENEEVRKNAAEALGDIGGLQVGQVAGKSLVSALDDPCPEVAEKARKSLERLGIHAIDALIEGMDRWGDFVEKEIVPIIIGIGEKAIPKLVGALSHPEVLVRINVARCLGRMGEKVREYLPALINASKDPDKKVRAEIRRVIRFLSGLPEAKEMLEATKLPHPEFAKRELTDEEISGLTFDHGIFSKILMDGRPIVKINGLKILSYLGLVTDYMPILLRDADPNVRISAATAYEKLGTRAKSHAHFLVGVLNNKDIKVRDKVVSALVAMFDDARDAIIGGLRSDPELAKEGILQVFEALKEKGIDPLIDSLEHPSPLVRINAATGLGMLARFGAEKAIVNLEKLLKDPVKDVRLAAANAINDILQGRKKRKEDFLPSSIEIEGFETRIIAKEEFSKITFDPIRMAQRLYDRSEVARINAINALMTLGKSADFASPFLASVLKDESRQVRISAIKAISEIGKNAAKSCAEILVEFLTEGDEEIKDLAKDALERMGKEALPALIEGLDISKDRAKGLIYPIILKNGVDAVPHLIEGLAHPEALVRMNCACILGVLGPYAKDIVRSALVSASVDPNKDVRAEIRRAIRSIDGLPDVPQFRESVLIPIRDFEKRRLNKEEIKRGLHNVSPDMLEQGLSDGRPWVRANAAMGLSLMGRTPVGLALLLKDSEVEVRRSAVDAIQELGKDAKIYARWIINSLADNDEYVKAKATKLLASIFDDALEIIVSGLRTDIEKAPNTILRVFEEVKDKGVDPLIKSLSHESPLVRANAARGLGMLARCGGQRAYPQLLEALEDEVRDVRIAAAEALEMFMLAKRGRVVPLKEPLNDPIKGFSDRIIPIEELKQMKENLSPNILLEFLSDRREIAKINAAHGFGALGEMGAGYVYHLLIGLKDPSPRVREATLKAFIEIGGYIKGVGVKDVVKCIFDEDESVRKACIRAIQAIGKDGLKAMIDAMDVDSGEVDAHIIPILPKDSPEIVNALVEGLNHRSPLVKANCARCIGSLGSHALHVKDALIKAGADPDRMVRKEVASALRLIIGETSEQSLVLNAIPLPSQDFDKHLIPFEEITKQCKSWDIKILERLLQDGRKWVRANSALALGALKVFSYGLIPLIRDSEVEVRRCAVKALQEIGGQARLAGSALLQALGDKDQEVREGATIAIAQMGEEAKSIVAEALSKDPREVKAKFGIMFEKLSEWAIDLLMEMLKKELPIVRINAAQSLSFMANKGAEKAIWALEEALHDPVKDVRMAAAYAIDTILKNRPRPKVEFQPEMPHIAGFEDRLFTEEEMERYKDALRPISLAYMLSNPNEIVKHNACVGLGVLGEKAITGVSFLTPLLRDKSLVVRNAAARALERIGPNASILAGESLIEMLHDVSPEELEQIKRAIKAFGTSIIPRLISALDTGYYFADKGIIPVLLEFGDASVPFLIQGLSHTSPDVRANCARCLAMLGPDIAKSARPALVETGKDKDKRVRAEVAKAIRVIDGLPPLPTLLESTRLPIENFDKKLFSFEEIASYSNDLDIENLLALARDGRSIVKANAVRALGVVKQGEKQKIVDDALGFALKDSEMEVRIAALESIARIGKISDKTAVGLVWALRKAPESMVASVVKTIDALGMDCIRPMLSCLSARPEEVMDTLGRIVARRPKMFVQALVEIAFKSENPISQENAVDLLGMLGNDAKEVESQLLEIAEKTKGLLQIKAVRALADIATPNKEVIDRLSALKRGFVLRSLLEAVDFTLNRIKQRMPRVSAR